jgi:hypothetical protein
LEDLLRSVRALAFLAVLATDTPLPFALSRLQKETAPSGIRDQTLRTDQVRLLEVLFATVNDWNWWPQNKALAPLLSSLAPRLRGVADELIHAPATASWWHPLDRSQQIWVHGGGSTPTKESLQADLKPLHPWASKPRGGFWTSTALPGLPSMWTLVPQGSPAPRGAVWRLPVPGTTRVWEIDGPSSWVELCRQYPDDTTQTYGDQWREWGLSQDRVLTPSWEQVAEEWDGVHLSMGGLLTTEGVPLDVGNAGTMLEGWGCEGTLWLRWTFGPPERLPDLD